MAGQVRWKAAATARLVASLCQRTAQTFHAATNDGDGADPADIICNGKPNLVENVGHRESASITLQLTAEPSSLAALKSTSPSIIRKSIDVPLESSVETKD